MNNQTLNTETQSAKRLVWNGVEVSAIAGTVMASHSVPHYPGNCPTINLLKSWGGTRRPCVKVETNQETFFLDNTGGVGMEMLAGGDLGFLKLPVVDSNSFISN